MCDYKGHYVGPDKSLAHVPPQLQRRFSVASRPRTAAPQRACGELGLRHTFGSTQQAMLCAFYIVAVVLHTVLNCCTVSL